MAVVGEFVLDVAPRVGIGSSAVRRLRREDRLPGIAYGIEGLNLPVSVPTKGFIKLAKRATSAQVFTLKSEDPRLDNRSALVKDIQKSVLKGDPLHLDLLILDESKPVDVRVPLHIMGEAAGVKSSGGVLSIARHDIELRCLPKAIPHSVEVDVSGLELGESLIAESLILPEGAALAGSGDEVIASVVASRTSTSLEFQGDQKQVVATAEKKEEEKK